MVSSFTSVTVVAALLALTLSAQLAAAKDAHVSSGGKCTRDGKHCCGAPGKPFFAYKACCKKTSVCAYKKHYREGEWGKFCLKKKAAGKYPHYEEPTQDTSPVTDHYAPVDGTSPTHIDPPAPHFDQHGSYPTKKASPRTAPPSKYGDYPTKGTSPHGVDLPSPPKYYQGGAKCAAKYYPCGGYSACCDGLKCKSTSWGRSYCVGSAVDSQCLSEYSSCDNGSCCEGLYCKAGTYGGRSYCAKTSPTSKCVMIGDDCDPPTPHGHSFGSRKCCEGGECRPRGMRQRGYSCGVTDQSPGESPGAE
jgi:hypothetical protein